MIKGDNLKGGALSRRASMLCEESDFPKFMDWYQGRKQGVSIPQGTHTKQDCIDSMRNACQVKSRAELDYNPNAAKMYWRIELAYRTKQANRARQHAAP